MGPTWVMLAPDGPHVGPMNLAIRDHTTVILCVENQVYRAILRKISGTFINTTYKSVFCFDFCFLFVFVLTSHFIQIALDLLVSYVRDKHSPASSVEGISLYNHPVGQEFCGAGCAPDHPLIARFMGPKWGPSGADRTQVGPMLAPWTLLSGSCPKACPVHPMKPEQRDHTFVWWTIKSSILVMQKNVWLPHVCSCLVHTEKKR